MIPATDCRSQFTRGLGQRPAASTSTRATSTPARIARTRGLSVDSRASASDSVKIERLSAGTRRRRGGRQHGTEQGPAHNTSKEDRDSGSGIGNPGIQEPGTE